MGIVGAEVANLDSCAEMVAERGDGFGDSIDRVFDPRGDGGTGALGFGRSAAVPAAESDGSGQLPGDPVHLVMGFGRTGRIVEPEFRSRVLTEAIRQAQALSAAERGNEGNKGRDLRIIGALPRFTLLVSLALGVRSSLRSLCFLL